MSRHSEPNKQNGRHLPLESAKPVLPTDNRICRDYVWGKCTKYSQCKFSHECDIESMKAIIQFCHDFQNPTGCNRRNCTYIHATSAEETLFREAGQIPADLAKRYAQIDAIFLEKNMKRNNYPSKPPPPPPESQPLPESRPPPPPPPPTGASAYQPRWFPILPPPPPPPPREPSHNCPPINNVPVYTHQQQPPLHMPMIDTSRPPPPLPASIDRMRLAPVKRHVEDSPEAGASKARRTQADVPSSSCCEECTQWDLRNLLLERRIQEKLAEKTMLVLKVEKDKKECKRISEILLASVRGLSTVLRPSTSASPPLDFDFLQDAISSNLLADTPELNPHPSQSQMYRLLGDLLKESDLNLLNSSSSVLSNELEAFFKTDSSLNLDNILSLSSNASPSTSSALLSTSFLGSSLPTPTHLPPPHAHLSHGTYHPHESQLQYPYTGNLSNGAGESTLPKSATSSTPSVPMSTTALPPSYITQSNYHYSMMGRPPPFQ